MKYFLEDVWKVAQIVLYGVFLMVALMIFLAIILAATPVPDGFEVGFAIFALALGSILIGICSGFCYHNIYSGFLIAEMTALILIIASHLICGNYGIRAENTVVIVVAGISGVTGSMVTKNCRKLMQKIRSVIFNRKGVKL